MQGDFKEVGHFEAKF